ncbi:MAG: tetratricopeptide repeat protein [Muribaculaceae bacterium]|nr:tetratricopeptide repeat protein [Muribaculaceae bacterium]
MNKSILIIIICLLSFPFSLLAREKKPVIQWDENARKAEYLYLEGLSMTALGKDDAFYELLKKAHELDKENTAISFYLGHCNLMLDTQNKEAVDSALSLMKSHIDKFPADYFESFIYAQLCSKLNKNDEAIRVFNSLVKLFPSKNEMKYKLADAYALSSDFKKGIEIYNEIEKIEGASIFVSARKINFYISINDTINAIHEAQKLIDDNPKAVNSYILKGDVYMQLAEPDSAILYYNKAQQLEPENGRTYLSKANYYHFMGDSAQYDSQIYNALISENLNIEDKLDVLTEYIRSLQEENDSSERVNSLFSVLIRQHPHETEIHRLYSSYLYYIKDYKGAAEQISYSLDIDPTNAEDWKMLMVIHLMSNNYPKAIEAAQKSMTYNPDNLELYQYIAPAYTQMKEYNKALEVYDEALKKIDKKDNKLISIIYAGMGDAYFSMGDTIKAFSSYDTSLTYFNENAGTLNNYAYFLAESNKDLDKAEKMSYFAIQLEPDNSTYLDTYAWIFFKKHDYETAKTYIKLAVEKDDTNSPELREHYGDILFMSGEPDLAVEQWKIALETKKDSELLQRKVDHKTYFYK